MEQRIIETSFSRCQSKMATQFGDFGIIQSKHWAIRSVEPNLVLFIGFVGHTEDREGSLISGQVAVCPAKTHDGLLVANHDLVRHLGGLCILRVSVELFLLFEDLKSLLPGCSSLLGTNLVEFACDAQDFLFALLHLLLLGSIACA